ncbi:MAG: hypothetical protein LBU04_00085 [Christensenellaceae bacterium]|jgi:hypothetical protein|nr:hypothetical protein [Christensenellaceae bacterium]
MGMRGSAKPTECSKNIQAVFEKALTSLTQKVATANDSLLSTAITVCLQENKNRAGAVLGFSGCMRGFRLDAG